VSDNDDLRLLVLMFESFLFIAAWCLELWWRHIQSRLIWISKKCTFRTCIDCEKTCTPIVWQVCLICQSSKHFDSLSYDICSPKIVVLTSKICSTSILGHCLKFTLLSQSLYISKKLHFHLRPSGVVNMVIYFWQQLVFCQRNVWYHFIWFHLV